MLTPPLGLSESPKRVRRQPSCALPCSSTGLYQELCCAKVLHLPNNCAAQHHFERAWIHTYNRAPLLPEQLPDGLGCAIQLGFPRGQRHFRVSLIPMANGSPLRSMCAPMHDFREQASTIQSLSVQMRKGSCTVPRGSIKQPLGCDARYRKALLRKVRCPRWLRPFFGEVRWPSLPYPAGIGHVADDGDSSLRHGGILSVAPLHSIVSQQCPRMFWNTLPRDPLPPLIMILVILTSAALGDPVRVLP